MLKIHFSQNDMRNMMLIQQTLIQYLLQKKNLCEIFKVLTIWGNINLFIRPQHHLDADFSMDCNSSSGSGGLHLSAIM